MKWYTDKKRVDKSFGVEDYVYFRLQPYKSCASQEDRQVGS